MRLVTYRSAAGPRAGIVVGERVLDVEAVARGKAGDAAPAGVRELLERGADLGVLGAEAARLHTDDPEAGALLADLTLGPPIPDPGKVICVGLNYRDHTREVGQDEPDVPTLFPKFANGLIGHDEPIRVPRGVDDIDFEAELGVVIGRRARAVAPEEALDYVAGITAVNDVSSRAFQFASSQWTSGKIVDTFAPCGPWLVTLDEVDDVQGLAIRTRLNGEVVQDGTTADMMFGVAELIAHISAFATLEPGDLIATGTPPGVGMGRTPPLYMDPGDSVEVEVESIGVLRNRVEAAGS